jgi:hypothetical protein
MLFYYLFSPLINTGNEKLQELKRNWEKWFREIYTYTERERESSPGTVDCTHNSSYSGGRDGEDCGSSLAQGGFQDGG